MSGASPLAVLSAEDVDRALTFTSLVDALHDAFAGDLVAPVRHHHGIPRPDGDATLLLMPAWSGGGDAAASADGAALGVKIVAVFPGNGARGLASVQGVYYLADGATGVPRAVIDGARLTLWRTACASALAARRLAREDARRMVMVGAGALAPFLVRAHASQRPIDHVTIWNRDPAKAEALAARLAAEGVADRSVEVVATADLESAVREADLVSCATLSREPIVRGEWLKAGAHLDLVGAFNLSMREADDAALARAAVYVDTPAALDEGGDVAVAIRAGAFAREAVRGDLFGLCRGTSAGRGSAREITLFKSVGAAIEDLAAAMAVMRARG
ncbi:ornithine cyclodeaminase family protein [Salinarimonas ramus]|uniref:Ornithine cyclodeaminase n=1 Tax=Salinarimonas ramus TaxID=690164 RepID=A0A917V509_9HYPH|nr:ornithine cyclodeaminase family protein [Salinarimonas ramus]GGK40711.1 ornithine cyclodeaminase [Salinarimonas ramus]